MEKRLLFMTKNQKNKHWIEIWKSFYTNKKESYLLINVTPIWMEIVSPPRNIVGSDKT